MIYINVFASDKGFLKRWKVPGPIARVSALIISDKTVINHVHAVTMVPST